MKKIGELNGRPLVLGNENKLSAHQILVSIKNDTVDLKERVNGKIKEISGGSSTGNYKYYDCSNDTIDHETYIADSVKIINTETNEIMIAPEAYFDEDYRVLAVAYDMSKRIYMNGEWVDIKAFIEDSEGFDFSAHVEITEEEFYRIPENTLIKFRDREKLGEIFEDLYAKLTSKGYETPLVNWFPDAPRISVHLGSLGYGSITLEVTNGTSENQIVERIYKRNGVSNTNDDWYDYDNPSEEVWGNATYIAFDYGYALSKFIGEDGKVIYGCGLLAG